MINRFLAALSLRPQLTFRALASLPWFFRDWASYLRSVDREVWPMRLLPILLDRGESSGSLGEYFWQDLFVARRVIADRPTRHIDVGSRIDGFVAHVASVRDVEVLDIRAQCALVQNVSFVQWDATHVDGDLEGVADCVTCLHSLEHFGLGRYGDRVDPDGWKSGIHSLAALVSEGGCLWLSVPVGVQRVEFNAHRVFSPRTIEIEARRNKLALVEFHIVEESGVLTSESVDEDFQRLAKADYSLGIFRFRKQVE